MVYAAHGLHHAVQPDGGTVSTSAPPEIASSHPSPTSFPPPTQFSSLSIKDLLDAREAYHVQLSSMESVVGTAIGRYCIHRDDWYATHSPDTQRPPDAVKPAQPRTLENTVIRPWSWPCVLVLVDRWLPRRGGSPVIPRRLYLSDGRVVPTCVVLAPPDEQPAPETSPLIYPSDLLGGGYPCVRDAQGEQRWGTIGCLVEREGTYYALTNRHVAGPDHGVVHTIVRGRRRRIGISDRLAANRIRMTDIFKGWPGDHTIINVDAGLVRLDDVRGWTSQVFGIGEIGELFDATPHTVNLDIIGCPLRAFGGASGVLEGEIKALFVRYKSLGGDDYVSDLLIGQRMRAPSDDPRQPHPPRVEDRPGNSGTFWFYDPDPETAVPMPGEPVAQPDRGARARRLRPIAMQWGGQRIRWRDAAGEEHATSHALATFVSTICRVLDVELVRGYGTGHDEYWGKLAHFSIGWKACDLVEHQGTRKLGRLMRANQKSIGFGDETLAAGKAFRIGRGRFIPLADKPDMAWRTRANEGMQHFADIDIEDIEGGPPLLDRCVADPRQIAATVWLAYFAGFAAQDVGPDPGTLPFRVWQLWQAMVDALRAGDVLGYTAAAGILAHYVADASQPLHGSWLHHGRPPTVEIDGRSYPVRHDSVAYAQYKDTRPADIHSIIDELVFEVEPDVALAATTEALADLPSLVDALDLPSTITTGWHAATAVIRLMAKARGILAPEDIIAADDPQAGPTARARRLWGRMRDELPQQLALATVVLARLWHSAWTAGNGDALPDSALVTFSESQIDRRCREPEFLAALNLEEMAASGQFEPPAARHKRPRKPRRQR